MKQAAFCLLMALALPAIGKCARFQQVDTLAKQPFRSTVKPAIGALRLTHSLALPGGATPMSPAVLPSNFYVRNLGFFCAREVEIDKKTRLPLRFRLGSVQYTDQLEGKNNKRLGQ